MSLARKCFAVAVVVGVAGWAGGCVVSDGDETKPPAPTWPYPDEASFCAQLGVVACNDEVVSACYGSSDDTLAADKEDCIAAYSALSECNPNGLTYHPETAATCLAEIQSIWSDARVDATELESAMDECIEVFYEGRDTGESCTLDGQCNTPDGARCVIAEGDAEGTCRVPDYVSGGYECGALDAVCSGDFYCNEQQICQVRPGVNDPCSATIPCNDSSLCNLTTLLCDPKLANGQPCTDASECQNGFCDKPRNSTEGVCAAAINLAATSSSCEPFLP